MAVSIPLTPTEWIWIGLSGERYVFRVHPIGERFLPNQMGNYIYAKIDQYGFWIPVYIGQGDLAERSNIGRHHRGHCILGKGATHFHQHLNANQMLRFMEERDLLDAFPMAYAPIGCNVRIGG